MAKKLFGTDGIRGVAGDGPLAPDRVLAVGRALGRVLGGPGVRAVLCRDTRRSGPLVRDALASGLLAEGIDVLDAGVRPTPALPYLAESWGCAFGVVISASHNPMEYNGIKVFGPDGSKLSDAQESEVEQEVEARTRPRTGPSIGRELPLPEGPDPYRDALVDQAFDLTAAEGSKVVVDCANGAAFEDAPLIFERVGFHVIPLHADPDGDNINEGCGALHPQAMAAAVQRAGAFAGVALDGDGDRAILADENGDLRDGDFILASLARRLKAEGKLPMDMVVGTVMSNLGLQVSLARENLQLHRTPVGDRHVAAFMKEKGAALGGEPSGHVIFSGARGLLPGDGILTALKMFGASIASGVPLSRLAGEWRVYPQTLLSVPVSRKTPFEEIPGLPERLAAIERELGEKGRVVLRYSGTEPVARVMVEGPEEKLVEGFANELAGLLERMNA